MGGVSLGFLRVSTLFSGILTCGIDRNRAMEILVREYLESALSSFGWELKSKIAFNLQNRKESSDGNSHVRIFGKRAFFMWLGIKT